MLVQAHIPVLLHGNNAALLDLEPDGVQRAHAGALDFLVLLPATVVPPREVRVVMKLQRDPDGGIEPGQIVILHIFHHRVNRAVNQLDRPFNERLVLGSADAGGERRAVVVLRKRREVLVELGLVLVRMRNGCLQVVRNDGLRSSAIEVESVFTGVDEVFLLLAHHSFHIGELGAGENGDEHFNRDLLAGFPVDEVQPVSCEVHIHPVAGLVLQVGDRSGLDEI